MTGLHKVSRWMRLFMILFVLLLLSTVTFYCVKSQYQLVVARQRETLGMVNKHLELNLNTQLIALQFLAADPEIRSLNSDEVYNEISHSRDIVKFSNIKLLDKQGRLITQLRETCPSPEAHDRKNFNAVLSGEKVITDVIDCTSYQPYVNLSVPVYNEEGYVQGVLSSEVLLIELANLIGDHELSSDQTIFIKDGNNRKVYASGLLSELMPPDEEFDQISNREQAEQDYDQDKIYLYMPVDNTKWQVILVTPVRDVYKTVFKKSLPELTILCLITLCAGLLYRNFLHKKFFQENIRRLRMERLISVNQLAASLAHEIRNPLTSIKGFIQLMDRGGERAPNQEHIKIILTEIDRIDKLTSEFQQLTRPLKTPHFVKVNIEQMIHDVVMLMENQAIVKNITLAFFNKINLLPPNYIGIMEGTIVNRSSYILGDEAQLKQVLINLVKNAIDAVGKNGEIKILLSRKEDFIVMEVKDNGIGMSKEILKKIGTPFYTTKAGGNGLGLSVCYNIIEGHGGSIKVKSEFGQGTIFSIKLPCAE